MVNNITQWNYSLLKTNWLYLERRFLHKIFQVTDRYQHCEQRAWTNLYTAVTILFVVILQSFQFSNVEFVPADLNFHRVKHPTRILHAPFPNVHSPILSMISFISADHSKYFENHDNKS